MRCAVGQAKFKTVRRVRACTGRSAAGKVLNEDEKFVDSLSVLGWGQNQVVRGNEVGVRPHIGRLVPMRLGGTRDIYVGAENAAWRGHMAEITEPGTRPVLRQVIDDIGSDETEAEVPGVTDDIEQNDLR